MRSAPGCCSAMPDQIGLDSAFTIHDREDSADLLNLLRHQLGFSKTEARFPTKGTCLAIYSRCVNAESPIEDVLRTSFPWCAGWEEALKELFADYVEAKQRQSIQRQPLLPPAVTPPRRNVASDPVSTLRF